MQAINAVQAAVTGPELATAMSVSVFAQTLGPGIALAVCNVIFDSSLKSQISQQVPGANVRAIIKAGATGFRNVVSQDQLGGILLSYTKSIDRVFYLVAALSAACAMPLFGIGFIDLRPKKEPQLEKGDEVATE